MSESTLKLKAGSGASSSSTTTATEERALKLLGSGQSPQVVASALGVSLSRISQLLSQEHFASEVARLRFESLSKHNLRDEKYDSLEDKLLAKLEDSLQMMYKPGEIAAVLAKINSAKRRGSETNQELGQTQQVVKIVMPVQIMNKFTTNINNQVIKAGDQTLVTIQSSQVGKLLEGSIGIGSEDTTTRVDTAQQTTRQRLEAASKLGANKVLERVQARLAAAEASTGLEASSEPELEDLTINSI